MTTTTISCPYCRRQYTMNLDLESLSRVKKRAKCTRCGKIFDLALRLDPKHEAADPGDRQPVVVAVPSTSQPASAPPTPKATLAGLPPILPPARPSRLPFEERVPPAAVHDPTSTAAATPAAPTAAAAPSAPTVAAARAAPAGVEADDYAYDIETSYGEEAEGAVAHAEEPSAAPPPMEPAEAQPPSPPPPQRPAAATPPPKAPAQPVDPGAWPWREFVANLGDLPRFRSESAVALEKLLTE